MTTLAKGLPTPVTLRRGSQWLWRRRASTLREGPGVQPVPLAYHLHKSPKPSKSSVPILILHGLFGSKRNNRSVSNVLARDLNRDVYAIDLRNHGDSPHTDQHDYTSMAEDVEAFIAEKELGSVTLIGHSMGAKTAMTVALRSSSIVEDLISVDNAPVDAALKSDFGRYVQGMRRIEEAGVQSQKQADTILQEFEESIPIRQFLLTNLYRPKDFRNLAFRIPIRTLALSLDKMADFPFKDPDVARFDKPSLFIRGTKSHYVADEMLPLIGRFFPRFELRDVEAGHWLISENFEAFRDAVVEFLGRDRT